jgi:type I restriction enzyme, R subunit
MPTEADTCRKFVVPKLEAAAWDNDLHSIGEPQSTNCRTFFMLRKPAANLPI